MADTHTKANEQKVSKAHPKKAVVIAPHHKTTTRHHAHHRLHPHHRSMQYIAALGMASLGLMLVVAFHPASSTMIVVPTMTISDDVTKIMPTLEPDLNGFNDPGISSAQLDESTLGH
jgi:hypothetical protein